MFKDRSSPTPFDQLSVLKKRTKLILSFKVNLTDIRSSTLTIINSQTFGRHLRLEVQAFPFGGGDSDRRELCDPQEARDWHDEGLWHGWLIINTKQAGALSGILRHFYWPGLSGWTAGHSAGESPISWEGVAVIDMPAASCTCRCSLLFRPRIRRLRLFPASSGLALCARQMKLKIFMMPTPG